MPECTLARRAACVWGLAAALPAWAQTEPAPATTSVVITATRTAARAYDVPASIDAIGGDDIRNDRAQINISESLGGVAGLLARDRQNYAQDVQISVRGFGARASFGIRGVRVYVDGIPATLPDGQGQISNVDLGSAARIEVLRGPYSALYGNSSGGVIQVFSDEGVPPPRFGLATSGGSNGVRRTAAQAAGASGDLSWLVSGSRFHTDGYRDHSEADRTLGNVKLTLRPDAQSKLTLVANSVSLPQAQDPLGLSRAQFNADPRSVDPSALTFNTRKNVDQSQAGLIYERRLDGANSLQLLGYSGHRNTEQYQAIAVATQAPPTNPGGVIGLGRDYRGTDLRWMWKPEAAAYDLVAGLAYDTLREHRQGFLNYIGATLGVKGALRRDEINEVQSLDPYAQAHWAFAPQWSLNAGVRSSHVQFKSTDLYITATNPDDSGRGSYGALLPVLGVMYSASPALHVYATAGRGFETPTLNELAYRPGGATGLNFGLQAATSSSIELGAKARLGNAGELNAAVFQTGTDHEIVTLTNSGGRATYQNAGGTRRQGFELGWQARWWGDLRLQLAATLLDATYRDTFTTCNTTPCAAPTQLIPAGNRLPGIARSSLFAAVNWQPASGWRAGLEARGLSKVYVNDANSDAAGGFGVLAAHVGYAVTLGPWDLGAFVRGDNLFNRRYAGSVIVNETSSRFFEPAPGRTWLAGVNASASF